MPAIAQAQDVNIISDENNADALAILRKIADDFGKQAGVKVVVNNMDHEAHKTAIRNYLVAGAPDICFWFSGNRMRAFVKRGLFDDISDLFEKEKYKDVLGAAAGSASGAAWTGAAPCFVREVAAPPVSRSNSPAWLFVRIPFWISNLISFTVCSSARAALKPESAAKMAAKAQAASRRCLKCPFINSVFSGVSQNLSVFADAKGDRLVKFATWQAHIRADGLQQALEFRLNFG